MKLDRQLADALQREQPAPGLAGRVLRRIENGPPRAARPRPWRAVAASVMLLAMGGGWFAHHEIERRAGERARDQALIALHIAGAKVRYAQEQVRTLGTHSND